MVMPTIHLLRAQSPPARSASRRSAERRLLRSFIAIKRLNVQPNCPPLITDLSQTPARGLWVFFFCCSTKEVLIKLGGGGSTAQNRKLRVLHSFTPPKCSLKKYSPITCPDYLQFLGDIRPPPASVGPQDRLHYILARRVTLTCRTVAGHTEALAHINTPKRKPGSSQSMYRDLEKKERLSPHDHMANRETGPPPLHCALFSFAVKAGHGSLRPP